MTPGPTDDRAVAYALLYPLLVPIVQAHGYTLAIHGSMINDFDLIACPWEDKCSAPQEVADAMCQKLGATRSHAAFNRHNRIVYVIYLPAPGLEIDLTFYAPDSP